MHGGVAWKEAQKCLCEELRRGLMRLASYADQRRWGQGNKTQEHTNREVNVMKDKITHKKFEWFFSGGHGG